MYNIKKYMDNINYIKSIDSIMIIFYHDSIMIRSITYLEFYALLF